MERMASEKQDIFSATEIGRNLMKGFDHRKKGILYPEDKFR